MRCALSLAMLAMSMASVTEARFGRLISRQNTNECCPCPAPGQQTNVPSTVTVTQPAQTVYVSNAQETPKQTVTVEKTVTAEPSTVYVSQPGNSPSNMPPEASQVVVTVSPQPMPSQPSQPQTVTVVPGNSSPAGQAEPSVITKTIQPEAPEQAEPQTVTVNAKPPTKVATVVTVTQGLPPSNAPELPSVVTVTQGLPSSEAPQSPSVVTVTASSSQQPSPQAEGPKTVVVTVQPSPATTVPATVTAPPQVQTVVQSVDHYSTLTKTVAGGGGDNVEIIIINIFTGETSCKKKHSGKPCHSNGQHHVPPAASGSSGIPCPIVNATTSVATVYNTVLVTLQPGNGTGAAQATTSQKPMSMGRLPRAPVTLMKW
ncbi:hypothetical protein VFPPC_01809 [Pochonia chlamydosporia 170]|uniref:Uncharacterized protein n=1 Tax=Pochonia chlamydosporia 170 TaxID=1380566 RepID=A0A179G9S5_METCM|nr:hypothetical protein VFPPC_01809 [Pochonia chlamydosporia 170]OAQ74268.1 hypothetical protein VFPPC_01809 [Pochonia chlamydosporia 170]